MAEPAAVRQDEQETRGSQRFPMFNALKHTPYRLYWFGMLGSVMGHGMQIISVYWLTLQLTDSPLMLGAVGLSNAVPTILLTFISGPIADHTDRRRMIAISQAFLALLHASMATLVVTGYVEVWHVLVFAFLAGSGQAFEQPSRQALIPQLIPRTEMPNAIAMSSIIWQGSRLMGPAVAGGLIALYGVGITLYMAAAGFTLFFVLVQFIHPNSPANPSQSRGMLKDLLDGLKYMRSNEIVYTLIAMTFFNSLFGMSYTILMPVFARDVLNVGSQGYGILQSSGGLGALTGTMLVAQLSYVKRKGQHLLIGATCFGFLLMIFAWSPIFWLSLGTVVLMGLANQFYVTTATTALQLVLPDEYRGRVMGTYSLTYSMVPLGGAISGSIAEFLGPRVAVSFGGAMVASMALLVAAFLPRVRDLE